MRFRSILAVLATLSVAAACASTPAVTIESGQAAVTSGVGASTSNGASGTDAGSTAPRPALQWRSCGDGIECTTLAVPIDDTVANGPTISLAINRHKANKSAKRIGVLLVNPGGPGVGGQFLVQAANQFFSPDLLDRFDIVAWDPRGTGSSSPIKCVDNLDDYFSLDPTPDNATEKQALIDSAKAFEQGCDTRNHSLLGHISTQDTARDIDRIRIALGEDKISFFGFSYGSELGATYATLFPTRVRAMVLDGASDPNADYEQSTLEQITGIERALNAFLADCAAKKSCALYNNGDPARAFDDLMASLDTNPLPSKPSNGKPRPAIGQGIAYIAVLQALYAEESWPDLARALADARKGTGDRLLAMYDSYLERNPDGTWSNSIDALISINCLDDRGPQDIATLDRITEQAAKVAPRLGRAMSTSYSCVGWPFQAPKLTLTAKGAGPIVVVGNTGDPVTPIESNEKMAKALEKGILLKFEGQGHTSYAQRNSCVTSNVDGYLVELKPPASGTICK
ncbi:MAG: alpha/beta hydrolase [Acidimicrobiia bacterium]